MAVESWGEKQICTKGVRDSKKLGKGLGVNITPIFALPHPFSVNSNSKSNMAGWINQHGLLNANSLKEDAVLLARVHRYSCLLMIAKWWFKWMKVVIQNNAKHLQNTPYLHLISLWFTWQGWLARVYSLSKHFKKYICFAQLWCNVRFEHFPLSL